MKLTQDLHFVLRIFRNYTFYMSVTASLFINGFFIFVVGNEVLNALYEEIN